MLTKAVLGVVMLVAGGCLPTASPDRTARPTLLNPRWNDDAFAEHLDVLRETLQGEQTLAPASRYVSAALREAWLQPAVEERYRLRPLFGRPSGYAGYVGGKHPLGARGDTSGVPVAEQAVLVCADLAGGEAPVEAAALLEVARLYGRASQYTVMPERSVVFALWPRLAAQDDPLTGLRAYLEQPTWRLDRVRAVLYVGLSARRRAEVQALLDEYDLPLYRVGAPSEEEKRASMGAAAGSPETAASPVSRARELAERTHQRLLAATLTDGKMMPSLGDSIRVPRPRPPDAQQP